MGPHKGRRKGRERRGSGPYLGRESSLQVFLFFIIFFFFNSITKTGIELAGEVVLCLGFSPSLTQPVVTAVAVRAAARAWDRSARQPLRFSPESLAAWIWIGAGVN